MRALVYDKFGLPEHVLRLEDIDQPQPRQGEVQIRVHAASVNSWDWDRLIGNLLGRVGAPFGPAHRVLGGDVAGVVTAIGEGITQFKPGDAVFGDLTSNKWGGFAEYVCAREGALAHKPESISFEDAATLPQAGLLAYEAIKLRPNLGAGQTVLVVGAGGGAGMFAVQIAKATGAHVTGVDKAGKGATVLAQGADAFIDYRQQDFSRSGTRYDFIIDMVGSQTVFGYGRALANGGRLAIVGGRLRRIFQVFAFGNLVGLPRSQRMALAIYQPTTAKLDHLASLAVAGTIRPVIDSTVPLEQAAAALRRIGDGNHIGKIVVSLR